MKAKSSHHKHERYLRCCYHLPFTLSSPCCSPQHHSAATATTLLHQSFPPQLCCHHKQSAPTTTTNLLPFPQWMDLASYTLQPLTPSSCHYCYYFGAAANYFTFLSSFLAAPADTIPWLSLLSSEFSWLVRVTSKSDFYRFLCYSYVIIQIPVIYM